MKDQRNSAQAYTIWGLILDKESKYIPKPTVN